MTERSIREWEPNKGALLFMNVAGLVMVLVGFVGYFALWAIRSGADGFSLGGSEFLLGLLLTFVLVAVLLMVHEGIHGIAAKAYGGSPEFGATMIGKVMPAFYCTAPGKQFTKGQFLVVALAPLVALGIACAAIVAFLPGGGWFVLPAALHLGGCVGDIAMAWVAALQPQGTLVEDMKSGMRFFD